MNPTKKVRIARVQVTLKGNGRYRWRLKDSMGCSLEHPTIVCAGVDKGGEATRKLAQRQADAWNADYKVPPQEKVPRNQFAPRCARSGEHCEAFTR